MTEIKHYCDRCNDRIEAPDRTLMQVKTGPHRHERPSLEFCDECTRAVFEFVATRPADCTAPRPKKSKAPTARPHA